jgi:hypothetical protein
MSSSTPATSHCNTQGSKTKPQITSKSTTPTIPPHVIFELLTLWSSDPRVPSADSRRKWSALRQVDPLKIGGWFSRKKTAAKKAGNPISEDTYELSLDPPPLAPPRTLVLQKKDLSGGLSVPHNSRRGHAHKRIKIEDLSSDDTAYNSVSTPSSDGTVIASDDTDSVSSKLDLKGSRKRAYSHFSDTNDESRTQLKDDLFSPASDNTHTLTYDNCKSSAPDFDLNCHQSNPSHTASAPSGHQNSESVPFPYFLGSNNSGSKTQALDQNHQHSCSQNPNRKLSPKPSTAHKLPPNANIQSKSKSSSASNSTCPLLNPYSPGTFPSVFISLNLLLPLIDKLGWLTG